MARVLTLDVLAAAYRGRGRRNSVKNFENRTMRSHAVVDGRTKALCGFDVNRLVDEYGMIDEKLHSAPSCPRCLKKYPLAKAGIV